MLDFLFLSDDEETFSLRILAGEITIKVRYQKH